LTLDFSFVSSKFEVGNSAKCSFLRSYRCT